MADARSTVPAIARVRWGIDLTVPPTSRFASPGWSYEERVGRRCPSCEGPMHSLRKPYVTSSGRESRYVALVCPACPRLVTLGDLDLKRYAQLSRTPRARQRTDAPEPTARIPADPPAADSTDPEARRHSAILRFWRSVELFSAQRVGPASAKVHRYDLEEDGAAPWEEGHPLQRLSIPPSHRWRFTVFGGLYELDRLHHALAAVFPENEFDLDERTPRGSSAIFAVEVTEEGRLILESMTLSTAAWAVGRSHHPGPGAAGWLDGFEADADEHAAAVESVAGRIEGEAGTPLSRPVRTDFLQWLVRDTSQRLHVAGLLAPGGLRVACDLVRRSATVEAGASDFLNSFVAGDLNRVARAVAGGDCGRALSQYLSATESSDRLDVRAPENLEAVRAMLAPDRVPAGRWPADPGHTAATSQQLAVNELVRTGGSAQTFAVNGPPGTGKTTLLRDLVAAVVTDRARQLAQLTAPGDAFAPESTGWAVGQGQVAFRPLRSDLAGSEMVVASSNNGAVENVTREMPSDAALGSMFADASYLETFAAQVLEAPAWGLIAAPLGNQKNRSGFVNRLWFSERDPGKDPRQGLSDWLVHEQQQARPGDWPAAVSAFADALERERSIRSGRMSCWHALRGLPALRSAHTSAGERLISARRWADEAARDAEAATRHAAGRAERRAEALRNRDVHQARRPRFWETVVTLGQLLRQWGEEDQALRAEVRSADEQVTSATADARARRAHSDAAQVQVRQAAAEHARASADLAAALDVIDAFPRDSGARVPDESWFRDDELRESAAPWLDPVWDEARSRVFLAALDLHRVFLICAGRPAMDLLRAAVDVVKGKVPAGARPQAVTAAWQGLFMLVPVVSTTFASVERMLGPLRREALGWLFVDEAGQAAPQQAVGAIWRSRRVVAVGDPLQLEPVVTVLHTTQARLRDHHGVTDVWLPSRQSVQTLADRVAGLGTVLRGDAEDVWVGAPLRVHRRCENPMFDVVNSAVYRGLMIHAVPPRDLSEGDAAPLRASTWFDVRSQRSDGNWIPEEGGVVARLLQALTTTHGLDPAKDILVVSPFRAVAHQLEPLVRDLGLPSLPTTGTVHRAQGKQARVVIFVLGGDPAKLGVRDWAARAPNLLNVAVSRAQQRIYVVGNHEDWARRRPYFSALAAALPVVDNDVGRSGGRSTRGR